MAKKGKSFYYILIVGLFIFQFPATLIMSSGGIFYTPVAEALGSSVAAMGTASSLIQVTMFFIMTTLGKFCKKYKMSLILTGCLIIEACVFVIRSMANSMWVFYLTSALLAIPQATYFAMLLPLVINEWFPNNSATVIGLCACAQGLGGMSFNAIGGWIIQNYGWRSCYLVWAGICLVFIPIALLIVKNRPADVGMKPFGYEKHLNTAEKVNPGVMTVSGMEHKKATRTAAYWLLCLAVPVSCIVSVASFYVSSYCLSLGFSVAVSGIFAGMVQGGNMAFKLMLGAVTDKSAKAGAIFYCTCTIICFFILLFCSSSLVLLAIGCFLFGAVYSATNLYGPQVVKYVFGASDFVTNWALVSSFIQIIGAMGTAGWGVVAEHWGYEMVFWGCIVLMVIALTLYMVALGMRGKIREQWTETVVAE